MTSKITSIIVCLALATCVLPSPAVAGSPSSNSNEDAATRGRVGLIVDVSALDEEFRRPSERAILDKVPPALTEAGYAITDGTVDLVLRVRFVKLDGGHQYHGIYFEFVHGDEAKSAIDWVHCSGCNQVRLDERLDEALPRLLEALDEAVRSLPDLVEGTSGGDGDGDGDSGQPIAPTPKPIGPLGGAGIGVAALGLGGILWGAVDLSRGRVYHQDLDTPEPRRTWTDFTPRGQVWLGVGVGAVALGSALLITDVLMRAKQRKQRGSRAGLPIPLTTPRALGLGWVQRF
jgi:hypothetical protein